MLLYDDTLLSYDGTLLLYDGTLSLYDDTLSLCDGSLSLYGDTSFKHVFQTSKMADIRMYDVLHIYGFSDLADNLERDKITPGILCLLSTQDMKKTRNYKYCRHDEA